MPKHDKKDPAPSAENTKRSGGDGNVPVKGEDHNQKKAEHVSADSRFSLRSGGEDQPGRQGGDGNVPVKGEKHSQKKAERVSEDRRW